MKKFPPLLPHGELSEVLPDIFMVSGQIRPTFGDQTWQFSRNMVVVRAGDALTLVNTLRLDSDGLARLDALGRVEHLVKLGSFHGRDDSFYLHRYDANLWSFPDMPHERGVQTGTELVPGGATPFPDGDAFVFETSKMSEGLLLVKRHGGILIACDSLQNLLGPDEYFDEKSAAMMGAAGFFRRGNIGPGWRNAARPEASDFARVKALTFQHLLSAHGVPLLNEAHLVLSNTFAEQFGAQDA